MKKRLKILIMVGIILCMGNEVAHADSGTYYINKNYDLVPTDKTGNNKVVLITIDDGPTIYGRSMAAILLKHKAHAIFFVNGTHDKANPGTIAFEYMSGFTIGNHTWDHPNLKHVTDAKAQAEIESNLELIKHITGTRPKFFRPPYGVSTPYVKDLVAKEGMTYVNWSGAGLDWEANTKDETVMMKNVLDTLHPGEILLLHEHQWTAKYLDDILTTIEKKGYTFADPNQIVK